MTIDTEEESQKKSCGTCVNMENCGKNYWMRCKGNLENYIPIDKE